MRWAFSVLLIFCLVILTPILIHPAKAASADSWILEAPLPVPFSSAGAGVVNGRIYVIGSSFNSSTGQIGNFFNYQFDPITDAWLTKTLMPNFTSGPTVAFQNKICVIGAFAGIVPFHTVASSPTMFYDPETDIWETKAPMPSVRVELQANVVDGKIYLIGGGLPAIRDFPNPTNLNEVYDPAKDSWMEMTPIPTPVKDYASAVVDNKIYIIGGARGTYPTPNSTLNLVQIYDTRTNQWSQGKPMPVSVRNAAAIATAGLLAPKRIYVFGGDTENTGALKQGVSYVTYATSPTNITQVYDVETDKWSFGASMLSSRFDLAVANVNDAIFALGGYNGSAYSSANEKYFPLEYSAVSSPSPTQIPTSSPAQSPTSSASPSPSITPSDSATQQPTSPIIDDTVENFTPTIIIFGLLALVVALCLLVYFKKRKDKCE